MGEIGCGAIYVWVNKEARNERGCIKVINVSKFLYR